MYGKEGTTSLVGGRERTPSPGRELEAIVLAKE